MNNRRTGEDITAGLGDYLNQKDQQYSRELSEVRSHLEERVKGVKTDLENDIREAKTDLKDDIKSLKEDLKGDIQGIRDDIKDRISGLRAFIGITVAIAAILIPLIVKALSS